MHYAIITALWLSLPAQIRGVSPSSLQTLSTARKRKGRSWLHQHINPSKTPWGARACRSPCPLTRPWQCLHQQRSQYLVVCNDFCIYNIVDMASFRISCSFVLETTQQHSRSIIASIKLTSRTPTCLLSFIFRSKMASISKIIAARGKITLLLCRFPNIQSK